MKKIIKTSIIVLLLAGVGYGAYRFFFKEKPAIIEIQKEKVEKGDVTTEVTATDRGRYSGFWLGEQDICRLQQPSEKRGTLSRIG